MRTILSLKSWLGKITGIRVKCLITCGGTKIKNFLDRKSNEANKRKVRGGFGRSTCLLTL